MALSVMTSADILLAVCMFLGAVLYTSVGHGGASAYLALMAIFGIPPTVMRPTALVMNVVVSTFVSGRFVKAGLFRWRALWPFLIGALPFAILGGAIQLPGHFYKPLVGVILWLAAARLLWPREIKADQEAHDPPVLFAALIGAGIGLPPLPPVLMAWTWVFLSAPVFPSPPVWLRKKPAQFQSLFR